MLKFVALLLLLATEEPVVFRFVDKQGVTHFTDRLGDVPEPYYSMYVAYLKERKIKPPVTAPVSVPKPNYTYAEGTGQRSDQLQKRWKALIADARQELRVAVNALVEVDTELEQARLNPIFREMPEVKAQIEALEQRRALAVLNVRQAENKLLIDLPKQARQESVPPKWLQ